MNKSAISNLFSSQTITPASWLTIVFSLVLAFAVGLFIAFVYVLVNLVTDLLYAYIDPRISYD